MQNKILFPLDAFAEAMDERLALAHADGKQGWYDDCTTEHLSNLLYKNLLENDLVSVANYCMFLWARNEKFIKPNTNVDEAFVTWERHLRELVKATNKVVLKLDTMTGINGSALETLSN